MFGLLLATAALTAGAYALLVLAASWIRHGATALTLHDQLAACPETRSFAYRIVRREPAPRPSAQVIRFPVKVGISPAIAKPLRAAA